MFFWRRGSRSLPLATFEMRLPSTRTSPGYVAAPVASHTPTFTNKMRFMAISLPMFGASYASPQKECAQARDEIQLRQMTVESCTAANSKMKLYNLR